MKQIIIVVGVFVLVGSIVILWLQINRSQGSSQSPATATKAPAGSFASGTAILDSLPTEGFSQTRLRILEILKQEYAKKPRSFDSNVLKYSEGFEEPWCTDFISWVYNQADVPYVHPDTGYWRIPGVLTLQSYYQQDDAYYEAGSGYTPQFGDVAFYFGETPDGGSTEHVAIVLAVNGDVMTTIGGNETSQGIVQVRQNTVQLGDRSLAGFGASGIE